MNLNGKIFLIIFSILCVFGRAQDLIIKTSGDSVRCKITEIGINTISYLKSASEKGPIYTISKKEIKAVKLQSGELLDFNKEITENIENNKEKNTADSLSKAKDKNGKNKIEMLNDTYYINGTAAKKKDVNRYLSKSNNPAIVLGLKGAKTMSLAQKITKITSYPTTIGGGLVSIVKIAETYQLVQRGRANSKAFFNTGLSILGTVSLPITSKILKKKSDKMYDKLIDMYNITN